MKKSILVIGIGRFGRGVIEALDKRGHDIFAIDQDEDALEEIRDMILSGAVINVGEDDEELARIVGDKNFDEAVVAMGSDFEGALIATSILKDAGVRVSVKAPNQRRGNVLKKMGADRVVYPERDMGRRLAHAISAETEIELLELPEGFVIEQLEVGPGLDGMTIEKLNASNRFGIWILVVYQNGRPIQAQASTVLNRGDKLIIFGKQNKISKFENANLGKK